MGFNCVHFCRGWIFLQIYNTYNLLFMGSLKGFERHNLIFPWSYIEEIEYTKSAMRA